MLLIRLSALVATVYDFVDSVNECVVRGCVVSDLACLCSLPARFTVLS